MMTHLKQIPSAEDQFEIQQALYAYCAGMDKKDYDLFRSAFTDDVLVTYDGMSQPTEGLEELAVYMERAHRDLDGSQHRFCNSYFLEFDGDTARVSTPARAMLIHADHPNGPTSDAYAVCTDEFRRTPDGWRICRKDFSYLWSDGH